MDWQILDSDRELWRRELESFVPKRIFDAHLHLYEASQFREKVPGLCSTGPSSVTWQVFQEKIAEITPGRETGGLAFAYPSPGVDFDSANRFLSEQTRVANARAQMLIQPSMDADFVAQEVKRQRFVGLKPYHFFATERPTFEASIPSFLPEHHMQVAHELGLSITLHIVRSRALADTANQDELKRYATRYPNARLILAHAARGFNPHHTLLGISALRGLRNVWFDTSAVTDSGAFEAIIRVMGHDRLLYGSDFPVSHIRGRCVALGDSFFWLSPQNTNLTAMHGEVKFSLIGLESLRSLKIAAMATAMSDAQVEDIFYTNAASMFGVTT